MQKIFIFLTTVSFCVAGALASCGQPSIPPTKLNDFIVGGKLAVPYSWPWQVALFKKARSGKSSFYCGGSVIANQWVITAGHCCYDDPDPSKYTVKLGVYNLTSNNEPGEQVVDVVEVHVNPQYKPVRTDFDITLLKLANPVTFTDHISPVCLPYQDQDLPPVGTNLVVTGWGSIKEDGRISESLREVLVPLVNQSLCDEDYGPKKIDNDNMFCAGLQGGGKDSCQGDSGGPVTYLDNVTNCFIQVGVVSWGDGCAESGHPGVYSRTSSYIDWISTLVPPPHANSTSTNHK
jgi:secreted trypsin-like serine protease